MLTENICSSCNVSDMKQHGEKPWGALTREGGHVLTLGLT